MHIRTILVLLFLSPVWLSSAPDQAGDVVVAALKVIPKFGDKHGNFEKFEDAARRAAAAGAKIIVTSECYLDGYAGGLMNKNPHHMTLEKLWQLAEPIDGPYVRKAAAVAKEHAALLVFGFSERRGDKVYNTAILISSEGKTLGSYSKSHTGDELYEPGNELPVFQTALGKVGVLICYDRQVPETSRTLALRGAEIILIPGHSPSVGITNEDLLLRIRAYENDVSIVWANPFNALVVNSRGTIIAHNANRDEEQVVLATVSLDARTKRGSIAGRRPELYYDFPSAK